MARKLKTPSLPNPDDLTGELAGGLVLTDPLLFRIFFFADELTEELSLEQKLFMCDESQRVQMCTARKIAKTVHLEAFVLQKGMTYMSAGETQGMVHTPNDVHINPVMDRLWKRIERNPLINLTVRTKSKGDHANITFGAGLMWLFRIEGWSGRDTNMVGIRAKFMAGDEGAFGNFICYNSRIQTALPDCQQIWCGVPNGVRNSPFYTLDMAAEARGWSRWSDFSTFINPIYQTPEAQAQLVDDYEGEDTQGYINNVLGGWGEETVSSFPPGSLAIRDMPYHIRKIAAFKSDYDLETQLPLRLNIPAVTCERWAIGWDYGRSPDPSVIMGAYTRGDNQWSLAFRINLVRAMPQPHQIQVVEYICTHLFNGTFLGLSCDNQDAIDHLQAAHQDTQYQYLWSNPGGTHQKEIAEDSAGQGESDDDSKPRVMGRKGSTPNKEHYTVMIKEWSLAAVIGLAGRKLWLPEADTDLTGELSGTTENKTLHGTVMYYPPADGANFGKRPDHNTETLRYTCDAIDRGERLFGQDNSDGDYLAVLAGGAWVGGGGSSRDIYDTPAKAWKAPWER